MHIFHRGLLAPLDKNNVDTDQIIPKQFLTSISRDGFDKALFYDWRYLENGQPDPEFILNYPCYQCASVLLTRDNFGCGSSREHAPWALKQYGFMVILAGSFADIFFNNCINNQILPITLPADTLESLFSLSKSEHNIQVIVDLENQVLKSEKFNPIPFDIRSDVKQRLLSGLDFIGVAEKLNDKIAKFEQRLITERPWQ